MCVCVCLSGCQKLIISSLHHILHSHRGFGPIQACPLVWGFLPPPSQVNAKCDVMMKLSIFGTRADTHTHKPKPIHPCYAGCNYNTSLSYRKLTNNSQSQEKPLHCEAGIIMHARLLQVYIRISGSYLNSPYKMHCVKLNCTLSH